MSILLVAIPVCHKDVHLVERNLERCIQLDGKTDHHAVICYDGDIPEKLPGIISKAETYFAWVSVFKYSPWRGVQDWPQPQNNAWQSVARWMEGYACNDPGAAFCWIWWEADATPLKARWLDILIAAYKKSKSPFFGNIVEGRGHMNGVALYPFNVSHYCTNAFLARTVPFDVVLSSECRRHSTIGRGNDYIAHSLKQYGGQEPEQIDSTSLAGLPSTVVLYHGCTMGMKLIVHSLDAVPTDRPSLMQVLTAWRCGNGKYKLTQKEIQSKAYTFTISTEKPTLWHVMERHKSDNADSERRSLQAQESWVNLYTGKQMKPCHVWRYPRSSQSIGDIRNLPFLKDVLCAGLTKCREHDVVVWTNDDTLLHQQVSDAILATLSKTDALSSFRVNFEKGKLPKMNAEPSKIREKGKFDLGRDLFAFRASWLIRNWHAIPDFLLAELEFDLVLAVLIRKLAGQATTKVNIHEPLPTCEIERGYVVHELHARGWVSKEHEKSPAKLWNQKLCREWYSDHGYHALISKPMPI